ncbi:hypothetical protein L6V77_14005 [Myxococcota bacterium]|nr:hypothetical protein [Myxococcota bacterium]
MFTRRLIALSGLHRSSALALALLPTLAACSEECSYVARCRGADRLEVCTERMEDGNRVAEEETVPCAAPNPVCVELDGDHARCVTAVDATCAPAEFTETCDGAVARRCRQGYVTGFDCGADGNACVARETGAACARAPASACDPQTFTETCDGTTGVICETGLVANLRCEGQCRKATAERGATVYCE